MSLADSLKSLNEFDINDLDINNAGIWPAPVKAIVVLIVFGLILGGGYWFFVKDQYAQLEQVERQEQELKQRYEQKAYQVANLDVFKAQMEEMEETFGAWCVSCPVKPRSLACWRYYQYGVRERFGAAGSQASARAAT